MMILLKFEITFVYISASFYFGSKYCCHIKPYDSLLFFGLTIKRAKITSYAYI